MGLASLRSPALLLLTLVLCACGARPSPVRDASALVQERAHSGFRYDSSTPSGIPRDRAGFPIVVDQGGGKGVGFKQQPRARKAAAMKGAVSPPGAGMSSLYSLPRATPAILPPALAVHAQP